MWRNGVSFFGRGILSRRRLTFIVGVISIPFAGCLLLLFSSKNGGFQRRVSTTPCNCPCARSQQLEPKANVEKPIADEQNALSTFTRELNSGYVPSTIGSLNLHIWSGVCGTKVDNLRKWPHFPYHPHRRLSVSAFHFTENPASQSTGYRFFGFVHPRESGVYKFAISSDDTSELWLSANEDPASSKLIARVYSPTESAWTSDGDYKKYAEQISKEVTLHTGKKYYIESLLKQEAGAVHLAVYWSRNSKFEIITSDYLTSFVEHSFDDIPLHAGKQNSLILENKRKLFYFHRLPLIDRAQFSGVLPTCSYSPSFLVREKLVKYQSVWLQRESNVYPQDDSVMTKAALTNEWTHTNKVAKKDRVIAVVDELMKSLPSGKYFLKKIHKVTQKPDEKKGDRFLLNLELGSKNTSQTFRLSEHIYQPKGNHNLCLPDGLNWNKSAKIYIVLPVKEQGNWVHYFIEQLTYASLATGDNNFHVVVADFESKDIDIAKAFQTPLLHSRHSIVTLRGKFYKTLALNVACQLVSNPNDIIFLFDLHIDMPVDLLDHVRMNTIAGRLAYFPIVGRLNCGSTSEEHQGFWQWNGFGIASMYKSDWERFGGMNAQEYKYNWGGEDWDLLDRVMQLPLEVERIRYPGLYHHYHKKKAKWN